MRVRARLAPLGLAVLFSAALAAADDPAPLLQPVAPAGKSLRVRLPVTPGFPKSMTLPGRLPNGKKKSELLDVTVALDCLPNPSYVTTKKLEEWGYDVPKGKEFVLPELLIATAQIAPKPAKGSDVVVRLTNVKFTVVTPAANSDGTIFFGDLVVSSTALFGGAERTTEPRLSFGDKFLEWTVPPTAVKRPGGDGVKAPEVTGKADAGVVPAYGALTVRGGPPVFAYAAINGMESYKTADGKVIPVYVSVSSVTNMPSGVSVTLGLQRGCKVEIDQAAAGVGGTGVESKTEFLPGKIKELRLGVNTGPGLKTGKDLVIKDLPVQIDRNQSEGYMLIGQKFIDAYFADGVYAADAAGWKLHGRVNPELLADPKTRPKKP
jgi:hypothetical protein